MSYLLYVRKSRKDAALEALGIDVLERHEKTLLELAKCQGLPVGAIYREVVSGDSIDSRPQMKKLLSEVEAGIWDGVLVMEVERLARGDTIDQGRVQRAFFYSSTLIITPAKTYDPTDQYDNEYFEFSLFMSRREYNTIKRRLQNGRLRSALDGYYVGNVAPYGWRRIQAEDGRHFTLELDETEGPIMQLMYDLIGNKQYGFSKTTTYLTDHGYLARSGKPFTPATVKDIIRNPVNIGKIRWNYRKETKTFENGMVKRSRPVADDYTLANGKHKAAIDLELFERANTPKFAYCVPTRHDRPVQNIFAGILYCKCCGRAMVRKKASTKEPYDYLICPYTRCETVSVKTDDLEPALIEWLKNYTENYDSEIELESNQAVINSKHSLLSSLYSQLDALNKQRTSLFDFLEQGIYTKEVFLERSNLLEERIKQCQTKIATSEADLANEIEIQRDKVNFIPRCKKILKNWDTYNVQEKNAALKSLIERIDFTKTVKNTRNRKDAPFTIDVHPRVSR